MMCAGSFPKSGTIGIPGSVHPGIGTKGLKSGTSQIIQDGWQLYRSACLCIIIKYLNYYQYQYQQYAAAAAAETDCCVRFKVFTTGF